MPQLDSLRALAVLAVLIDHFWRQVDIGVSLGMLGVQLFFVLSGFLITGILLQAKEAVAAGLSTPLFAFRRFYIRRVLRIFPLFYGTIALAWLAGLPEVRDSLAWHLAYANNRYFAWIGEWHGAVSHFWSLAVEEQFYLVWPFVVLFTPRRRLRTVLLSIVLLAPAFRIVGALSGLSEMALWLLPLGSLDSLGLGGLLAAESSSALPPRRTRTPLPRIGLSIGLPLFFSLPGCSTTWRSPHRPSSSRRWPSRTRCGPSSSCG